VGGIVVEEVRHNHLLQELEPHMEAVDIPVAAGHMEAAEEEDIALVGRMAVVEGGPHTVLEEGLEEGHHIDLVAEEGIDLEGGHHIEVVDSLVGRKVAVAGELRIWKIEVNDCPAHKVVEPFPRRNPITYCCGGGAPYCCCGAPYC
tara:strand:+ start:503 stop:940 length:438 start_codon:yes stop_codon:yes gene_type:complete